MIQDIAPHTYDNAYQIRQPKENDYVVICRELQGVLIEKIEDEITFPLWGELTDKATEILEPIYLFAIDERGYFLVQGEAADVFSKDRARDFEWIAKMELRFANPQYQAFAAVTVFQLANWYQSRRFCGKCGHTMIHDMTERMMYCPVCKTMEYPKISPAVIVAVTDHNRLLLTKYAGRNYKKYALIAGFAEIGETIEETVCREVMEEVGMKVKNLRYYKSQPWSFSETLLFGFYAEVDGSREIVLDEQELSVAEWFERDEIPVEPTRDSLTNEMIIRFKNGKEQEDEKL